VPGADALLPSNSLEGRQLRGAISGQESGWFTPLEVGADALLPSNSLKGGPLCAATSDQESRRSRLWVCSSALYIPEERTAVRCYFWPNKLVGHSFDAVMLFCPLTP